MKIRIKRVIGAAILSMITGVFFFFQRETADKIEVKDLPLIYQEINRINDRLLVEEMEKEKEQINMLVEASEEKKIQQEKKQEIKETEVSEELIDLPQMEWALFLCTEFSWGASGAGAKRYAIYGDFTKSKKEAEDTYFSLCQEILEAIPELAAYTEWEDKDQGYEYQLGWVEIMDEHIVDCSQDMNGIVSWERNDFLSEWGVSRWYHNGVQIKAKESYIDDRNLILQQKDEKEITQAITQAIERVLEEVFGQFNTYYGRNFWEIDSAGQVMAVANGMDGEGDGIQVYSLALPKVTLLCELPISVDEARWPIQVSQIVGDENDGWIVFSYGYETFRITYPEGKAEKLGEYMFSVSYSPDEKYLAYCTGNEAMWDYWMIWAGVDESMIGKYVLPMKEEWKKIPQGWYVINLETEEKSYIPISVWIYDADRPLYGGNCTWIEKDKLMELLELE